MDKLIEQTELTSLSSPFTGSDIYDTMFSDSTRGDISPSELGSGEGSGDDNDFTMFETNFFTGSTSHDTDSTATEESESPANETTIEAGTGTTEFGTEVTESSDITDTDVTFEGSGTTIEEGSGTSPEEGSGASASTSAVTEETTVEETQASTSAVTSESDSKLNITHCNISIHNGSIY